MPRANGTPANPGHLTIAPLLVMLFTIPQGPTAKGEHVMTRDELRKSLPRVEALADSVNVLS